jgi:hypothetical protein
MISENASQIQMLIFVGRRLNMATVHDVEKDSCGMLLDFVRKHMPPRPGLSRAARKFSATGKTPSFL